MDINGEVIEFNDTTQILLQIVLGFIIFGVALDIKLADFKQVAKNPKGAVVGLGMQFLLFPALTFLLIWVASLSPSTTIYPSVALGMLLVAACPGGNMSNFFSHLAGGNTALSVCMSAISTLAAVVMTPFNFAFWGSMLPETNALLQDVSISFWAMLQTITILLGIPLAIGMLLSHYAPMLASKMQKPMKIISISLFAIIIIGALGANHQLFLKYIGTFAIVVAIQNLLGLGLGYWGAKAIGLPEKDCRTVSIEVGIQNSALGLILYFQYFNELSGIGIITAWWGVWHMISGLSLATYWQRKSRKAQLE